jgi:outer membrane protein assembly factor BamB
MRVWIQRGKVRHRYGSIPADHAVRTVIAFDLTTGSLKWLAGDNPGGGEFYPTPAPDVDKLYVSGLNGFYALRP